MNNAVQMTQSPKAASVRNKFIGAPSSVVEYAYYGLLLHQTVGEAWGLEVRLLPTGILLGLACLCVLYSGPRAIDVYRPIAFALGCAIFTLFIQMVVHQESILEEQMRSFVTWIPTLIILQSLCWRKGFLHRFALMAFLIGCATLPFLEIKTEADEFVRMGISRGVGLANPNALGLWFSFCTVYFLVAGLKAKNNIVRVASWSVGVLSLYVVGLTVSRGALLGVAIAGAFVFQKELKRAFAPLLVLLWVGWIVYMTGFFDEQIGYYLQRGDEDTGRTYLWSTAFNGFLNSWWAGVGISNARIPMPSGKMTLPHNSPLYIGLASGVIPFAFFVGYLVRAFRGAFRARAERTPDGPFKFPLVIVALLGMMLGHTAFMNPWVIVILSLAMTPGDVPRARRITTGKTASDSGHRGNRSDILPKIQPHAYKPE